jgi:hypothetical protein
LPADPEHRAKARSYPTPKTRAEYRAALERAAALRSAGATAEDSDELAAIEGAIAQYVGVPGQPEVRKGRPDESGQDSM